jgi:hypothetical protein
VRTTLDIDDDVLLAVKDRARSERRSAGEVISDLARQALTTRRPPDEVRQPSAFHSFEPFPPRGRLVTNSQIDELREDEGE